MQVIDLKKQLREARARFKALGGRSVDLADEIDWLEKAIERGRKAKGKPVVMTRFKLKYLREIIRNACLNATQPKEKVYPVLCEAPAPVLARMVTTLGDALEMVSKVFMAKMGSEQSGKSFESELKGLKAAMDAVEFPPSTKNQKKCPRRKQGPGRP